MKMFKGVVISTKMDKTATVVVERAVEHPIYKKRFTRVKKYHVHDPYGVNVGQTVEFKPSKPYSKLKKWIITSVDGKEMANIKKSSDIKAKKSKNKNESRDKSRSNTKKGNKK